MATRNRPHPIESGAAADSRSGPTASVPKSGPVPAPASRGRDHAERRSHA